MAKPATVEFEIYDSCASFQYSFARPTQVRFFLLLLLVSFFAMRVFLVQDRCNGEWEVTPSELTSSVFFCI